ncbi:hypothetical protein U9M48_025199 [Paspalum notatum var. saurae]|uniref:Uncharacterized protein n=1 Tax=Paspalum notatum var. saurae TaxID=547442 RepID=A0AAQ3TNU1_PASNO
MGQHGTAASRPSSSANNVDDAPIEQQQQQDARVDNEELVALPEEEGLLLLPVQLQRLHIYNLSELICLCSNSHDDNKEDGQIRQGGLRELPSCSSKLQVLCIGDVAGVTGTPICSLLCSSLTKLIFRGDQYVKRFTEEQETLLFVNSLEEIRFQYCKSLQALPARLLNLPNLKILCLYMCERIQIRPEDHLPNSLQELCIHDCTEIRSLPDGLPGSLQKLSIRWRPRIQSLSGDLPSSLQELSIDNFPEIRSLPKDSLPSSLQKLEIRRCPAIWWLPKVDDLPSSMRELNVRNSENEELRTQRQKLKGIIPIVHA